MQGERNPGRGTKHVLFISGIIPFPIERYRAASELKSDVHFCSPSGDKVDQIYVDAEKRKAGTLEEYDRATLLKFKEGICDAEGKLVMVSQDELNQASARREGETRVAKVEPFAPIDPRFIKAVYQIGPQKGSESTFLLVASILLENNFQIVSNGVEGGQTRRFVIYMQGNQMMQAVLYLPQEVLKHNPVIIPESLPENLARLKPKMEQLLVQMKEQELEPIKDTKVANVEELFLMKAQGIVQKVEKEEKPREVKSLEELMSIALETKKKVVKRS